MYVVSTRSSIQHVVRLKTQNRTLYIVFSHVTTTSATLSAPQSAAMLRAVWIAAAAAAAMEEVVRAAEVAAGTAAAEMAGAGVAGMGAVQTAAAETATARAARAEEMVVRRVACCAVARREGGRAALRCPSHQTPGIAPQQPATRRRWREVGSVPPAKIWPAAAAKSGALGLVASRPGCPPPTQRPRRG